MVKGYLMKNDPIESAYVMNVVSTMKSMISAGVVGVIFD